MDIFISWSGDRSKQAAVALKSWLEIVFDSLTIWISTENILVGTRWAETLSETLDKSNFGILCITPENLRAPWLIFEAGALSKSVKKGSVVPLLYDLSSSDIPFPLAQFQTAVADRAGAISIVKALITRHGDDAPNEARIIKRAEALWQSLETDWAKIPPLDHLSSPAETSLDRAILDEMLLILRRMSQAGESPVRKTPEGRDESLSTTLRKQLVAHQERLAELRASGQRHLERFNDLPTALEEAIQWSTRRIEELEIALDALAASPKVSGTI